MTDLRLEEYIGELRRELAKAAVAADDEDLQFEVGPVEVTLSVKVVKSAGPSVKFHLAVFGVGLDAGANASLSKEGVQTVKLTLTPALRGERGIYIDGEASENER